MPSCLVREKRYNPNNALEYSPFILSLLMSISIGNLSSLPHVVLEVLKCNENFIKKRSKQIS